MIPITQFEHQFYTTIHFNLCINYIKKIIFKTVHRPEKKVYKIKLTQVYYKFQLYIATAATHCEECKWKLTKLAMPST